MSGKAYDKVGDKAGDKVPKNNARRIGSAGLIEVAYNFISKQGLDRLTFRHIASHANCSLGTLTYHFSSREDLISAVLSDKFYLLCNRVSCYPIIQILRLPFLKRSNKACPMKKQRKTTGGCGLN